MSFSLIGKITAPLLALVALAAGLALVTSSASAQHGEAEVRIAAQRLADGQLEFALQESTNESWGERRRPGQHNFPADATAGAWLDSSALAIDAVGQVRISARLGDDGRVEFTLQQQQADGTWGERLQTQRRFFPADTEAGIWLVTTPLTISTPAAAGTSEVTPEAETDDESGSEEAPVMCLAAQDDSEPAFSVLSESSLEHRSFDGEGNNLDFPTRGMAGTALLKLAPTSYADGISTPTTTRPNARTVSNLVFAQAESIPNSTQASDILWQWGQFIDHDITLSPDNLEEPFPVPVPQGDPIFDPEGSGQKTIHLDRSVFDPSTGTSRQNIRRQTNAITAFIDASQVYGSDENRALALRTNDGTGRLKTSHEGRFLPYNEDGLDNEGGSDLTSLFLAGDLRVNEQIGLISMHTLFVREHNRLADVIASQDPSLSGDEIYQLARKIVGAQIQAITINEFLPLLLGPDAIAPYAGYDATVDPTIASEFSATAYRVGHTLLSPNLHLLSDDGESEHLNLAKAFFNPSFVEDRGISVILRGFASQLAQEIDSKIIDEVRNMLLRGPNGPVFDLAVLNIQRGRDHGVGDFNTVRSAYGLAPLESFADISSDPSVQQAMMLAYGDVEKIDLWSGGLAEDHAPGAMVGETLQAIISDQFRRLRDGDRFWFENDPYFLANTEVLDQVRQITLASIFRCNTAMADEIQDSVFIVKDN